MKSRALEQSSVGNDSKKRDLESLKEYLHHSIESEKILLDNGVEGEISKDLQSAKKDTDKFLFEMINKFTDKAVNILVNHINKSFINKPEYRKLIRNAYVGENRGINYYLILKEETFDNIAKINSQSLEISKLEFPLDLMVFFYIINDEYLEKLKAKRHIRQLY